MTISAIPTGDVHDFDFLTGAWTVANRRLKNRLTGSDDWEEFAGTTRCEQRLGGVANVDESAFPAKGFSAMTLRLFDREQRRWSIWWITSDAGVLTPPVAGGFDGDRGEFYGADVEGGRPVHVRFIWKRLGARAAHWEQAFSLDGERWETNWMMAFTRV